MHFVGGFQWRFDCIDCFLIHENLDVLAHATVFVNHSEFDSGILFVQMIEQFIDAAAVGINFRSAFGVGPEGARNMY